MRGRRGSLRSTHATDSVEALEVRMPPTATSVEGLLTRALLRGSVASEYGAMVQQWYSSVYEVVVRACVWSFDFLFMLT